MWGHSGGPTRTIQPVLFAYDPSTLLASVNPWRLLDDFAGILQADGLLRLRARCGRANNITPHLVAGIIARRKFVEAPKGPQAPRKGKSQTGQASKADIALSLSTSSM